MQRKTRHFNSLRNQIFVGFVMVMLIVLLLAGITAFIALALLTFSVTLAVGGILTVLMVGRALSLKMKPAPVRATARTKSHSGENMRIWNDGRGTIIDL